MYYADRAIDALEKTKGLAENCGCDNSMDYIFNGLVDLKKSADPEDWDKGRYFAQKAYEELQSLISAFDVCTSSVPSVNYDLENTAVSDASSKAIQLEGNGLKEKQRQLEQQQQELLEQQRVLAEKIAEQKRLTAQMQRARDLEYEEQLKLKRIAELTFKEYGLKLKDLMNVFDCSASTTPNNWSAERNEEVLRNETLEATRKYYMDKVVAMQKQALDHFNTCVKK